MSTTTITTTPPATAPDATALPDDSLAGDALEDHPLADLFPLMEKADLQDLAEDIRAHGLRAPITLHEGRILDGRNRYRACQLAGIAPKTRPLPAGQDALAFSLAANLHRRHLTASQRAIVAAKIAQLSHGGPRDEQRANLPFAPSITEAASKLSVSRRLVVAAKTVIKSKVQTRAVESGKKTVHAAVQEMKAAKVAQEILRDATGYPIPEELAALWQRKAEVEALLRHISQARCAVKDAGARADILFAPTNLNGVLADLNKAYTRTQLSVPHAVCATCQGRAVETCLSCKGRGFVSKHHFERCVPEEIKAIRARGCQ